MLSNKNKFLFCEVFELEEQKYMYDCTWAKNPLNQTYHDTEWGWPLFDDQKQFEFLMLEVMQCGLSWTLMMKKREIFRKVFLDFDFDKVAVLSQKDICKILIAPQMIKSSRKIQAVIQNARAFQKIRKEFGSFSNYLWSYSKGKVILYQDHEKGCLPSQNGLSKKISKDLRARGFSFLGPVTVYSHLQACGIINDHGKDCPIYHKINQKYETVHLEKDDEG